MQVSSCYDLLFVGAGRIPTEFFVPLLEKAYAKLYGCYESLAGGFEGEALQDFCGTCQREFSLKELRASVGAKSTPDKTFKQNDLWHLCNEQSHHSSLVCLVNVQKSISHPTLTCIAVEFMMAHLRNGNTVPMVRFYSMQGKVDDEVVAEFKPGSPSWDLFKAEDKVKMKEKQKDDEHWVRWEVSVKSFDYCEITNLKQTWDTCDYLFHGEWQVPLTAGGGPSSKNLAVNPHYKFNVPETGKDKTRVIISLFKKYRRQLCRKLGKLITDTVYVGYDIYAIRENECVPVPNAFFMQRKPVVYSGLYRRNTISSVVNLQKGDYIIVPYTEKPLEQCHFMLALSIPGATDEHGHARGGHSPLRAAGMLGKKKISDGVSHMTQLQSTMTQQPQTQTAKTQKTQK